MAARKHVRIETNIQLIRTLLTSMSLIFKTKQNHVH